jgi:glycosyltransferase involved in cell wall biosynthesis
MTVLYLADIRLPLERANGIQTMETCHALARRGHDVRLLVRPDTTSPARDPFAFYDLPPLANFTIVRVGVRGPAPFRRVHYLTGAIAEALLARHRRDGGRWRADVIFTRDLGVASMILRWPRSRRPPLIYESHGYAPVVTGLLPEMLSNAPRASRAKGRRLTAREKRVWEHADGYVTITSALAQELERRLGPRAGVNVDVIPDGARVDPARRFEWDGPPPLGSGASAGTGGRGPLVTYAGHLYPWKGVETLLGALAAAPGLRGRVIGGHPSEPDLGRLRQFAANLGLGERVEFTGMKAPGEVPALLREADLLVLPNRATSVSANYTSPLKLFEYLAAGRPIVASDLPALREILRDRENAWLVPPDDTGALAAALETLARDKGLAVRLAKAAFDSAGAYSWDARAERLEQTLARATAARPAKSARPGPRRSSGTTR